jgi:hypothetical protein
MMCRFVSLLMFASMVCVVVLSNNHSAKTASLGGSSNAMILTYTGYAVGGIVFLFFCAVVFLRQRINIAIQVAKEAASAVVEMPGMQVRQLLDKCGLCFSRHHGWPCRFAHCSIHKYNCN